MMIGLRLHSVRGTLAFLCLLVFFCVSPALAQGTSEVPATLRLTQVVPRLPIINLYAIAQDEGGRPVALQASELSALVGSTRVPVEIRRGDESIAIVFLVDISKSLSRQQFNLIKKAVAAWIDSLGRNDQAAIVTFGSRVKTVIDFTADKQALETALGQLGPTDMQTLLYQGLVRALDLSHRLDRSLPLRRAIVVLTDGLDDQAGGAGLREVQDKLKLDPTTIYGIGASASAKRKAKVDAALKDFAALVRLSRGDYRRVDIESLNKGYADLRKIVDSTMHLTASCPSPKCSPDGSAVRIQLFMAKGKERLSSEVVTVRAVGSGGKPVKSVTTPPSEHEKEPEPSPVWDIVEAVLGWLAKNLETIFFTVVGGTLTITIGIAGTTAIIRVRNNKPAFPEIEIIGRWFRGRRPSPIPTENHPDPPNGNVIVAVHVAIPHDTHRDKRRLRLFLMRQNELEDFDMLFEGKLSVGRSPDSDICIKNDGQVSANHCSLSPKENLILVEDLGSLNGTRVNGVPIKKNDFIHAESNAVLGVGRTELRMQVLPAEAG